MLGRRTTWLAALIATTAFAPEALGGEPERLAAEALFTDGRALLAEGKNDEACAKFAASQKLDPSVGALINLAECATRRGETASAWLLYRDAAALAARNGDRERERIATSRAETLTVSRLSVRAAQKPPGFTVKVDGAALDRAVLDLPTPANPGPHAIEASAPGRARWRSSVRIPADGSTTTVDVPPLAIDPAQTPAPATERPASEPDATGRTAGFVVGGVGIVALGLGVLFSARASSVWGDVTAVCPERRCPDARTAADLEPKREEAHRDAVIATVALGVGLAAVATGIVLLVTSPSSRRAAALMTDGAAVRF
jgi:hypothetical protein